MATKPLQPLRVALVGAGGIAKAHARAIANLDDVMCTALCDVNPAAQHERNQQLGGTARTFTDLHRMLKDAGKSIDAVVICLPHHLHTQALLDCAAAGKHILCEKPLCTALEDADRIAAAITRAGVIFMAAHNQLFAPMVEAIKARLHAGDIGQLRWLRAQDCFLHGPGLANSWRGQLATQGGGELIDTGYHPTYTLLHFADADVVRVRACMARFEQPIEGEDTASVQLLFANGVIGEIFTSWAFARPNGTHKIHLIGSQGQLFGSDNVLFHLPLGAAEATRIDLSSVHGQTAQLAWFRDCVRGERQPLHGIAESREVLRVILAATEDASGWQQAVPR